MKKLVTALLAAVMVLSMCAAAPAEEKTAEYPWPKYDKVQDVCIWFPVNYDCPDVQMVEDAVNAISVERYGIRYHFVVLSVGQYQTQLNLALTGDDECDAFKNTGMINTVKNGQVYDMTEFFDNDPNKDSIVEWADRFNKRCRVDGRLYVLQAPMRPAIFCVRFIRRLSEILQPMQRNIRFAVSAGTKRIRSGPAVIGKRSPSLVLSFVLL